MEEIGTEALVIHNLGETKPGIPVLANNTIEPVLSDNLTPEEADAIDAAAKKLLNVIGKTKESDGDIRAIISAVGESEAEGLREGSDLLMRRIMSLESADESDVNKISDALLDLHEEVEKVNPNKFNFEGNKLFSWLPFIGKPLDRYLGKFKSASSVIEGIIHNIEQGALTLKDNNTILSKRKQQFRQEALKLQRILIVLDRIDQAIVASMAQMTAEESDFYNKQVLAQVRKKSNELYEILITVQQGFMTYDVMIETAWELIDKINHTKRVTKRALEIGVETQFALNDMQNALAATKAMSNVTQDLLKSNAQTLKTTVAETYKQSTEGTMEVETFRQIYNDINEAISIVDQAKRDMSGQLKGKIDEMKKISGELETKIQDMEQKEEVKTALDLTTTKVN